MRAGPLKTAAMALIAICVCATANACEPIVPMVMAIGGPAAVLRSLYPLLAAIAFKSVLFAWFQHTVRFGPAFLMMLAGNVVSTIAGILAALMFAVPAEAAIPALILFGLCWFGASRLPILIPRLKLPPPAVAAIMMAAVFASVLLFGAAYAWLAHFHYAGYWVFKVVALCVAISVSILLSAMWEEWTIWKLSRRPDDERAFFVPVLRANLYTMMLVMLYGAILMLPQRMKSNDFLVKNARPPRPAVHSRI